MKFISNKIIITIFLNKKRFFFYYVGMIVDIFISIKKKGYLHQGSILHPFPSSFTSRIHFLRTLHLSLWLPDLFVLFIHFSTTFFCGVASAWTISFFCNLPTKGRKCKTSQTVAFLLKNYVFRKIVKFDRTSLASFRLFLRTSFPFCLTFTDNAIFFILFSFFFTLPTST